MSGGIEPRVAYEPRMRYAVEVGRYTNYAHTEMQWDAVGWHADLDEAKSSADYEARFHRHARVVEIMSDARPDRSG